MEKNIKELLGGRIVNTRVLTNQQISQLMSLGSKKYPVIYQEGSQYFCRRCLTEIDLADFHDQKMYCRACLNFGKLRKGDELIITNSNLSFHIPKTPMTWQGQLTNLQDTVAQETKSAFQKQQDHLIWALTGAGKTEIIYPLINEALLQNKRVAICSPRVDVCLELQPRLQQAFRNVPIGLFHGQSQTSYFPTPIMISTVHQLIRFESAFDLIIVDEVDSFPLAGDEMLHQAIYKAKKDSGSITYLSASPPVELLANVKAKKISLSKLYQRFHGHPLPEPQTHLLLKKSQFLGINPRIKKMLSSLIKSQTRFMLFFPRIPEMLQFAVSLQKKWPNLKFVTVSSKDSERLKKVQQFREERASAILTTTILERGVTFHKVAVIVIDADSEEFSKTALIQIAGRAGRFKDAADDLVHFFYQYYDQKIKSACCQIKQINQQAVNK